jgi:proline racemase
VDAKQTADAALVVYAQEKVASVRRLHRLRPRMAVLSAREQMEEGEVNRARSIIGSEFVCRIGRPTTIGGRAAIVPHVSAGPGLPASTSICSTSPINGLRAIGLRTHGRVLGRQFERFARRARLD